MKLSDIPNPDTRDLRSFGITTGTVFAAVFGIVIPWIWNFGYPVWPWIIFAILVPWGILAPDSLRPVYRGWMYLGLGISKITTPIVLGIVFFLVVLPVGIVMRVFRKDPMERSFDRTAESYRVKAADPVAGSLERPY